MLRLILALVACAFALPVYAESPLPSPEAVIDQGLAHEEKPVPQKKAVKKTFRKNMPKTVKKKDPEAPKKSGPERTIPPDRSKL